MKTLTQYRADIEALMSKVGDIDAQAVNENRDLTEAEVSLKNEILDAVEDLHKTVATLERQDRMAAKLAKPEEPVTVEGKKKDVRIEGGEPAAKNDRFGCFGEQMSAIMRAAVPGGRVDPRLYNATGMNETVSSDGGFLVQQDFTQELLQQVWKTGVVAPLCRKVTISGNANGTVINGVDETSRATGSRSGGIRGYWAGEAEEKTASKPKFRRIELNLKKLIGLCYATDEMLQDSSQLESVIRTGFVNEFGFLLDDSVINGTGNDQPLGVLNAGCLVEVAKETGQDDNTILAENVINMYSRLFAPSRQNAVWLINQNVEPQLFQMSLAVGTGGTPVYMPAGGLSGQPYGTLFGRPVLPIEQAQSLGTKGDIILGDFTNGYILAEKGGIQSDMSIHVRFVYDESVFRFVMRVDGQPVRKSALTPYKGGSSYTQSHFITLAAR